jgi:hypothetical protein
VFLKAPRAHPAASPVATKTVAPARPSGPSTIIAKAEAVIPSGAITPNSVPPAARDSIIRKALPVDDDGNEISPPH